MVQNDALGFGGNEVRPSCPCGGSRHAALEVESRSESERAARLVDSHMRSRLVQRACGCIRNVELWSVRRRRAPELLVPAADRILHGARHQRLPAAKEPPLWREREEARP